MENYKELSLKEMLSLPNASIKFDKYPVDTTMWIDEKLRDDNMMTVKVIKERNTEKSKITMISTPSGLNSSFWERYKELFEGVFEPQPALLNMIPSAAGGIPSGGTTGTTWNAPAGTTWRGVNSTAASGINTVYVTNEEDTDMKRVIDKEFNKVNSKILVAMIDDFVMDFIDSPQFSVHQAPRVLSAIDIIYDLMYDLEDEDKIMNFKVIADDRNNPPINGKRRDLIIDLYFRQTNCINQTHMRYTIHE